MAGDFDSAEANAAAAIADSLKQFDTFTVESYGGVGSEQGELGGELRGAATALSDAAGAGRGRGLGILVGWLLGGGGGVGVGIGLWGDGWAAVSLGDMVCGYCRGRHVGWFIGRYV